MKNRVKQEISGENGAKSFARYCRDAPAKIDDLEKSRMVAIITAPQIDMLRNGISELMEQINGAFVKTIPVLKWV